MRVVITGATGTIGRALSGAAHGRGDQVVALTRAPERARAILGEGVELHAWPEPKQAPPPPAALAGADAVVHLLGEPIAQRWTSAAKREIRDSRVLTTRSLVHGLGELPEGERPATLVCQSASGQYGSRGGRALASRAPPATTSSPGSRLPGSAKRSPPRRGSF